MIYQLIVKILEDIIGKKVFIRFNKRKVKAGRIEN